VVRCSSNGNEQCQLDGRDYDGPEATWLSMNQSTVEARDSCYDGLFSVMDDMQCLD
jgi:hypothetical protein